MEPRDTVAIKTRGLTRRFGDKTVVDRLDLDVPAGQIFGLLGPNAAGKSTTIRMLIGVLRPSAGSMQVLGQDTSDQAAEIKQRTGYVAQQFALYPELSVSENLSFFSTLYENGGTIDAPTLFRTYGLERFAEQRAGTLSGGYKRRLAIACAVSHDPDLIYLDEPTAGIDPVTRKELWDRFYELAAAGKTLFVTTHYMEEAERCHRLAFIHHGRLVACDTPEGIKQSLRDLAVYSCRVNYSPALSDALQRLEQVLVLNQFGGELRIIAEEAMSAATLDECISKLVDGHTGVQPAPVTIEDAFMALTRTEVAS